jgi:dimethylargininase
VIAITRPVSDAIVNCELTHIARAPIDLDRATAQHDAYERALEAAGCRIVRVAAAPDLPDAVFVEDTAVVLPEIAVITRPGAASRRAEIAAIAEAVGRYRRLRFIDPPGTLDGGDVVFAGRRCFVGRTTRTNEAAIAQLAVILGPIGYDVEAVDVRGCLHLKSAAASISENQLLVNPAWISRGQFAGVELLPVDPAEPAAANILHLGDGEYIYASAFPRTRDFLERRPLIHLRIVDLSELAKAEGAVTCCSLILTSGEAP